MQCDASNFIFMAPSDLVPVSKLLEIWSMISAPGTNVVINRGSVADYDTVKQGISVTSLPNLIRGT
ncbi:hypothetical protein sscle_05g042590 [Sclerotinia sclerotiorum 1980 UF-70]|nr:hypothetical protein sscle_05g042590 [Sclerotinia sclerotiorum 1980 UF-70]